MKRSEIITLWLMGLWTIGVPFAIGWLRLNGFISVLNVWPFLFYFLLSGWIILGLIWLTIRKWPKTP